MLSPPGAPTPPGGARRLLTLHLLTALLPAVTQGWFPGLYPHSNSTVLCQNAETYVAGGVVAAQGEAPVEVILDRDTYLANKPFHLSVRSKDSTKFRGVIVQARTPHSTINYGHMTLVDGGILRHCDLTNDTLFFWHDSPVSLLKLTWMPPIEFQDEVIQFVATVFEDHRTAWMDVKSAFFSKGFKPIDTSGCGGSKGCFRYSPDQETCSLQSCDYIFTYQMLPNDIVEFELSAVADWVAIGFSSDKRMGGDDVLLCETTSDNGAEINHYVNNPGYTRPKKQSFNPTTKHETEVLDGRLSCRFQRPLTVEGDEYSEDLNNDWYHLYAWGRKSTMGAITRHSVPSAPTSEQKVSLLMSPMNVISAAYTHTLPLLCLAVCSMLTLVC